MAAGESHFALELNEKELIELLENATPESTKKATGYGMKIFQGKILKTLFWQFKVTVDLQRPDFVIFFSLLII